MSVLLLCYDRSVESIILLDQIECLANCNHAMPDALQVDSWTRLICLVPVHLFVTDRKPLPCDPYCTSSRDCQTPSRAACLSLRISNVGRREERKRDALLSRYRTLNVDVQASPGTSRRTAGAGESFSRIRSATAHEETRATPPFSQRPCYEQPLFEARRASGKGYVVECGANGSPSGYGSPSLGYG